MQVFARMLRGGLKPAAPREPEASQVSPTPAGHSMPEHGRVGFSAYGEDLLVLGWFNHYSVEPTSIRYLDIGAATPEHLNNTFLLHSIGGRGLLVEPDPDQAKVLSEARPRDTVAQVGVAFDERRAARLFRFTNRVFNTFSEKQAEFVLESSAKWPESLRQKIVDRVEVELVPINELISSRMPDGPPHLLSLDVEGVELQALHSLDVKLLNRGPDVPSLICAEAHGYVEDWLAILGPHGYQVSARTPDNLVFRRDPAWVTRDNLAGIRSDSTTAEQ